MSNFQHYLEMAKDFDSKLAAWERKKENDYYKGLDKAESINDAAESIDKEMEEYIKDDVKDWPMDPNEKDLDEKEIKELAKERLGEILSTHFKDMYDYDDYKKDDDMYDALIDMYLPDMIRAMEEKEKERKGKK